MKILLGIWCCVLFSSFTLGQKKLPSIPIEDIKEKSNSSFIDETPFYDEIYTYLSIEFDSTGTKQKVIFSEKTEGLCSFSQSFKDIDYQINTCKLPSEKEVIVHFHHNYSLSSIQKFVEQLVKTYDIDEIPFKWNSEKTMYSSNQNEIQLYFELTSNNSSIILKHYFRI